MALTKAKLTNLDTNESISVLFNPTEYTVKKTNSWEPKPVVGKNVPKMTFTGGGQRSLDVELLVDKYDLASSDAASANISDYLEKLWNLTMIAESTKNNQANRARPPMVLFEWGQHYQFRAVITNMTVKYTLFLDDGTPVRATATMTLEEASDAEEQPRQNPTSHAMPGYKRREVRPQDTLALIAFEEYGDSNRWRAIAEANRIDDPANLRPGQILSIPPNS